MSMGNRVLGMIARGIVRLIDDSLHTQFVQVEGLDDAPSDGVEHHQPYGFASHPPPGSTALVLLVGGAASHPVAINAFHPDKRAKNLAEGEVGLYDHQGRLLLVVKAGGQPLLLLGGADATAKPTMDTLVEAEFEKVRAALNSVAGAGGAGASDFTGANTYTSVGSLGAENVRVK